MLKKNKYLFCGCSVELRSEEPVVSEGMFSLFSSDFEAADYTLDIIRTDSLPTETGKEIFRSDRRRVFSDGEIKLYTSYFNSREKQYVDYACKIDDRTLYVCYPDKLREIALFDALNLPSMLLKKGIGILHCSFIDYHGSAILFSGNKQVGKSTQAALWKEHRNTQTINGDRAALAVEDGKIFACGIPFCGTSKICKNKKLPLKAIICLDKGKENRIERLSPVSAFMALLGKFTYDHWEKQSSDIAASLVGTIAENVPVFSYSCVKDSSAVDYLEKELLKL